MDRAKRQKTEQPRDSRRIRELMQIEPMDKYPGIPRIAFGINGVLVFRCGHLFYAWDTSAAKLWQWASGMPEVPFWHEMTKLRHRIVFHADDLKRVCNCVLDRGEPFVVI